MERKNGTPELVSMLQYMKETRIDNPEIIVKDSRILELDEIVTEVKESEEWEAVQMNMYEILMEKGMKAGMEKGMEKGMQKGMQKKLIEQIEKKLTKGCSVEEIADKLEEPVEIIQKLIKKMKK